MVNEYYGIADLKYIAAGAAILASGGGGSYLDAVNIIREFEPPLSKSTETHYLYNLNENLIMYSSLGNAPNIIAPDSICYYSESNGIGFSNATNDLALYFNSETGKSTGSTVSVIKVNAAPTLCKTPGVVASFGGLLRNIGYAGALPYSQAPESGI